MEILQMDFYKIVNVNIVSTRSQAVAWIAYRTAKNCKVHVT